RRLRIRSRAELLPGALHPGLSRRDGQLRDRRAGGQAAQSDRRGRIEGAAAGGCRRRIGEVGQECEGGVGTDAQSMKPLATANVALRVIDWDNLNAVLALDIEPAQQQFVASNAVSLAEAHFNPGAWFRAVYADDILVGFTMLFDPT